MRVILVFLCSLLSCLTLSAQSNVKDSAAVAQVLMQQQTAWNNGNIEGFMQGYWNSDSLQFVSPKGMTLGYAPVLANYKKSYPDKKAMKELRFGIIRMVQPQTDVMLVTGRWDLLEEGTSKAGGYFTLLFKRFPEGWKIIADHTN